MENLCKSIKDVVNAHPGCAHWHCGDYNLPDIDWSTETLTRSQYNHNISNMFVQTLEICNMNQIIDFPTRKNNTLDILFTNRPTLMHKLTPYPGLSDHDTIIQAEIDCRARVQRPVKRKVYQWNKMKPAEISKMKKFVQSCSTQIVQNTTPETPVEEIWLDIKQIALSVMDKFVPNKFTSTRYTQPWMTRECKTLIRKKHRLYNRARRSNSTLDWDRFKEIRKRTQKLCRTANATYISTRISDDPSRNNKFLYRYVKSKRTDNNGVSALVENGEVRILPNQKANALNRQFSSVFSPASNSVPDLGPPKFDKMPDIVISETGVQKLLRNLKPNKAPGPDNIQAKFLKETAEDLAPALTCLYQASLAQTKIPSDWRHARVAPIYKSGKNDRSKPANYRPISLTSISCKVLEHIMCSNLMGHLDKRHILTDFQHGFRHGRSCETQLILTVDEIAQALDQGKQIDCILLDFAKAFDKVSHKSLLAKLHHYGVQGSNLGWIQDFLTSRTQVVVVDGEESETAAVTSGVPQGSVLGPALFLVYINDLPEKLHSTPRLFADDCLLYKVIESTADCDLLQRDLHTLEIWENDWSMQFAAEKCMVLRVTRKHKKNILQKKYKIHNHVLEAVDSAKYLGIIFDSKLSFNHHIQDITKKANNTRQFLQRTLSRCDRATKEVCYKTYVRPTLEYASTVWDPHKGNKSQTNLLESAQNKAARFAMSDWSWSSSVTGIKSTLQWESLQERRARARVVIFHKIQYSLVAIPMTLFQHTPSTITTRGAPKKFVVPFCRTQAYKNTFIPTVPVLWNSLPPSVATVTDPDSFRRSLPVVRLSA